MSISPNGQIPALDLLAEPRPGDHFHRLFIFLNPTALHRPN
jgi:hypothetical protein